MTNQHLLLDKKFAMAKRKKRRSRSHTATAGSTHQVMMPPVMTPPMTIPAPDGVIASYGSRNAGSNPIKEAWGYAYRPDEIVPVPLPPTHRDLQPGQVPTQGRTDLNQPLYYFDKQSSDYRIPVDLTKPGVYTLVTWVLFDGSAIETTCLGARRFSI